MNTALKRDPSPELPPDVKDEITRIETEIDFLQSSLTGQSIEKQMQIIKQIQDLSAKRHSLKGRPRETDPKETPPKKSEPKPSDPAPVRSTTQTFNAKPIETIYNGHRFRSRLEARWAVFFDACGIDYEYEPEGFQFEDGTKYLPDFLIYVRHRGDDEYEPVYVEVKGVMMPSDLHKIDLMSKCYPVYVVGAFPPTWEPDDSGEWGWFDIYYSFAYMDDDCYPAWFSRYNGEWWLCGPQHDAASGFKYTKEPLRLAKYARFEHGETPRIERRNA